MITVKELIEKLKTCDPDAYVAAYSQYEECDVIICKVLPNVKRDYNGYDDFPIMEDYSCRDDSNVAWYLKDNPDKKFVLLKG